MRMNMEYPSSRVTGGAGLAMSPFSHHGLPVGGKEWMQQGGHRERNATRGMGLENERYCDMGVHLRASASIAV